MQCATSSDSGPQVLLFVFICIFSINMQNNIIHVSWWWGNYVLNDILVKHMYFDMMNVLSLHNILVTVFMYVASIIFTCLALLFFPFFSFHLFTLLANPDSVIYYFWLNFNTAHTGFHHNTPYRKFSLDCKQFCKIRK